MGLTISSRLISKTSSTEKAKELVEQMRQHALDLPFEKVDDKVRYFGPDMLQWQRDDLRRVYAGTEADEFVDVPWQREQQVSVRVEPLEFVSFSTMPGPGSEPASFGLARYPAEIDVMYCPKDDEHFMKKITTCYPTYRQFDWKRWERWLQRNGRDRFESPEDENFQQNQKIKTHLSPGWRWAMSCKTEYAINPKCGGIPNFICCHLSVIHLLDRIAVLPTMKVKIWDQGRYGPNCYADPLWERETWHDATYDVKTLLYRVDRALSDLVLPTTAFPDIEHLEFKSQQNHPYLAPFLQSMKRLADQRRAKGAE
jgi:hypothetical protein